MTGPERGYLLLTAQLGDPGRRPLTRAQFRELTKRMHLAEPNDDSREMTLEDLTRLGIAKASAEHILTLLSDEALLDGYLARCAKAGITILTRISRDYPQALRRRLGPEAPGVLFCRGDVSTLSLPAVSLVGSRELRPENETFAREAGFQAASQGYVLVSGNAKGADRAAQEACLAAGGKVISVVADSLLSHAPGPNILWVSQEGIDLDFSAQRALSRNRIIHALPGLTLVAQSSLQTGGTWSGTVQNLRQGWSPVHIFNDNSPAADLLTDLGATPTGIEDLSDFSSLSPRQDTLFHMT